MVLSCNYEFRKRGGDMTSFSKRFIEILEQHGQLLQFNRGNLIYGLDDPNDILYWVKKGFVKLSYLDESGRKLSLDIFGSGNVFGELSLTQVDKRELIAESLGDSEVLAIDRNRLLEQVRDNGMLMLDILKLVGLRSRLVQHKLEDMAFKDLPTKLARVLVHLARKFGNKELVGIVIDCKLTHQDLADLTGAARNNITELLNKLYRDEVLVKGSYITISDERELNNLGHGTYDKILE